MSDEEEFGPVDLTNVEPDLIPRLPIKDRQEEAKEKVKTFLEEQKNAGMVDCVVIGSLPGNMYHVAISDSRDRTALLGNLELAKLELFYSIKMDP